MSSPILTILDYVEKTITNLGFGVRRGNVKTTGNELAKLRAYSDCLKLLLPMTFTKTVFVDFDRHLGYMERFFEERNFNWIMNNLNDIRYQDLQHIKENIYRLVKSKKIIKKRTASLSNKVFIVHGRNHDPMEELEILLENLGLDPVVLHKQPSGSRTIVEKLEKYSDVGYAFVILTPDDTGISRTDETYVTLTQNLEKFPPPAYGRIDYRPMIAKLRETLLLRARQNVILEFGYFMGLLGRDRVCCLYKGDVELPSDMHGIVYIPFKESVNEVRDKIVKELKAASYRLKIQ